jgi:DNA-binding protein HU-beta
MSGNINKKELINMIAEKVKQMNPDQKVTKKEVEGILDATIKSITDGLQNGHKISLIGFGSFMVKERKATLKTNPKDPSKKIQVPAKKLVKFKPSDKLNDSLN